MNEENNVTDIDQREMNKLQLEFELFLLKTMNGCERLSLFDKLRTGFAALGNVGYDIDIRTYRDFLVDTRQVIEETLQVVNEGLAIYDREESERNDSPMQFFTDSSI